MIDVDRVLRVDADTWQRAVDSGVRGSPGRQTHHRRMAALVASVFVLAAAILALTLAVSSDKQTAGPTSTKVGGALRGFTWVDPDFRVGTVVFGRKTANVSDGCSGGLRKLHVTGRTLTIGRLIGRATTCAGLAGGSTAGRNRFDHVVQGRLRWSVAGRRLTLTRPDGESITLVRNDVPAASIVGERWILTRVDDRTERKIPGPYRGATFLISSGRLRASDLCNVITADVRITATTIRFSRTATTARACPDLGRASDVIDAVLLGEREFSIFNGKLYISGRSAGLLVYVRAR